MRLRRLVALLPLALTACGYNTIQTYDEKANAAKQQIEVQLQRRADLVPNLVEVVRGQAKQELEVFTQVAKARSGLVGRRSPQGNARLGVLVLETVEELVDSHDHTWPDAIERVARLIKGDADYVADADYETDTERDNEPRYV